MDMRALTEFYSGYFADQGILEGSGEIVGVAWRHQDMKDQVSECLRCTEQMILHRDPAVLTVFEDTCLFAPTGDCSADWSQLDKVFAGIRDAVTTNPLWVRS